MGRYGRLATCCPHAQNESGAYYTQILKKASKLGQNDLFERGGPHTSSSCECANGGRLLRNPSYEPTEPKNDRFLDGFCQCRRIRWGPKRKILPIRPNSFSLYVSLLFSYGTFLYFFVSVPNSFSPRAFNHKRAQLASQTKEFYGTFLHETPCKPNAPRITSGLTSTPAPSPFRRLPAPAPYIRPHLNACCLSRDFSSAKKYCL